MFSPTSKATHRIEVKVTKAEKLYAQDLVTKYLHVFQNTLDMKQRPICGPKGTPGGMLHFMLSPSGFEAMYQELTSLREEVKGQPTANKVEENIASNPNKPDKKKFERVVTVTTGYEIDINKPRRRQDVLAYERTGLLDLLGCRESLNRKIK